MAARFSSATAQDPSLECASDITVDHRTGHRFKITTCLSADESRRTLYSAEVIPGDDKTLLYPMNSKEEVLHAFTQAAKEDDFAVRMGPCIAIALSLLQTDGYDNLSHSCILSLFNNMETRALAFSKCWFVSSAQ